MKKLLALLLLSPLVAGEDIKLNKDMVLYCLKDGAVSGGSLWYLEPEKQRMIRAFYIWEIKDYISRNDFKKPQGTVTLFASEYKEDWDSISAFEYLFPDDEAYRKEKNWEQSQGLMKINTRNLKYHWKQYWSRGTSKESIYDTYGSCAKYDAGLNLD
jgi:hypothetical protein